MLPAVATLGREPVHYEICERFAPIFLRRTHVKFTVRKLEKFLKRGSSHIEFFTKKLTCKANLLRRT
ncbi:hypothetical protein LEP1GSC170_1958 [Leptospira interrogans serovar Bataviae str. HAI135]|nr:hypothetical protein LEP1GSC170_1958 [Leptospira interrogans serovar Bataviae str. HAI135]